MKARPEQAEWLLAAAKELEMAWNQIQSLEEELARTNELAKIMANMGQNTSSERNLAELEGTKEKDLTKETEQVPRATLINEREWEKEYEVLKDELITRKQESKKTKNHFERRPRMRSGRCKTDSIDCRAAWTG